MTRMPDQRKMVTSAPENRETPLESVRSWVTPTRLFFVRNHFAMPEIDPASWRLVVDGRVKRLKEWTLDELLDLPQHSVFATVECAGNGRSFLSQKAAGVQWGAGAIGHAEWSGVPLHRILEQVGLEADAMDVCFQGADVGSESDHPKPMPFERSLPLAKALHPDTLLALSMNGEPLDPVHGFPVRLFVPGWYGVASVKWLRRITVANEPFRGYFQSIKYTFQRETQRGLETEIVGPMRPKSEIIRPRLGEQLGCGRNRCFGIAWAGEEAVSRVEVSVDGGATWRDAALLGPQSTYSWTFWEYFWDVDAAGGYTLLARATSSGGRVQPMEHDPHDGGYHIHHARPRVVRVAGQSRQPEYSDAAMIMYDMNAFAEENMRLPLDVEMAFTAGEGI